MVVGLPLLAVAILLVAWFPVWRLARLPAAAGAIRRQSATWACHRPPQSV